MLRHQTDNNRPLTNEYSYHFIVRLIVQQDVVILIIVWNLFLFEADSPCDRVSCTERPGQNCYRQMS